MPHLSFKGSEIRREGREIVKVRGGDVYEETVSSGSGRATGHKNSSGVTAQKTCVSSHQTKSQHGERNGAPSFTCS